MMFSEPPAKYLNRHRSHNFTLWGLFFFFLVPLKHAADHVDAVDAVLRQVLAGAHAAAAAAADHDDFAVSRDFVETGGDFTQRDMLGAADHALGDFIVLTDVNHLQG